MVNDCCPATGRGARVADFWGRMAEHQGDHGEGSVTLGLNGRFLHWSCVRKVSPRGLSMADSGTKNHANISRIDRRLCTRGKPTAERPHVFDEASLVGLDRAAVTSSY